MSFPTSVAGIDAEITDSNFVIAVTRAYVSNLASVVLIGLIKLDGHPHLLLGLGLTSGELKRARVQGADPCHARGASPVAAYLRSEIQRFVMR